MHKGVYLFFIDYVYAFDKIQRKELFEILDKLVLFGNRVIGSNVIQGKRLESTNR